MSCKKASFTLSEVLITLVIIGIIAAITVPIITSNYQEEAKKSRIRKMYSTIANAMTYVKANGGDTDFEVIDDDNQAMKEWFDIYLAPYLSITKVCYNTKGCWSEGKTKYLKGGYYTWQNDGVGIGVNVISVVLNDGSFISMNVDQKGGIYSDYKVLPSQNTAMVINFDIDGAKGPNTIGKDVFAGVFTENGFVPAYKDASPSQIESDCNTNTGTGFSCILNYLGK